MALFDKSKLEEFLSSLQNFKMTLEALVTLAASAKLQYLHTIFCGEALHQLYNLCVHIGSTTTTYLSRTILGLCMHFFIVDAFLKQKCVICRETRKPHE